MKKSFKEQPDICGLTEKRAAMLEKFKIANVSPSSLSLARTFSSREAAEIHQHEKRRAKVPIGDYFEFMINEVALKRSNQDFFNALSFDHLDVDSVPEPAYAFCDWFKCTQPNTGRFQDFCSKAFPYFAKAGFDIYDTEKGMNGYSHCFALSMSGERVGSFAADERMGGLFELTGAGCRLVQARWSEWLKLMWSLNSLDFGITRMDVSTDFQGQQWSDYGVTVPELLYRATNENMFVLGSGSGARPSVAQFGDWSGQNAGEWNKNNYDPSVHAPGGLTFNVGKASSANQFTAYEKTKEQLGKKLVKTAEKVDLSHVRIERRFRRGTGDSKVVIPFNFAVSLDEAFIYNCKGLEDFMSGYIDFTGGNGFIKKEGIALKRVGNYVKAKVLKKAYWLRVQGGKCVNTLLKVGFSADEIITMIVNPDKGISGFIDDITDKDCIYSEFEKIRVGLLHAA